MRGSSLANREVLEALTSFVVVTWSGKPDDDEAAEIRELWEDSRIVYLRKKRTNIFCFILDSKGRLVHAFGAFPNGAINPNTSGPSQDAKYFRGEIEKGTAKLTIPEVKSTHALRLPDVRSGIRLFVRSQGPAGDMPLIVEAVADEQWKELAPSQSKTTVDPKKLFPWLRQIYPPGFNEQMYGWKKIEGTASLEPAGADQAILKGTFRLATRSVYGEREEIAMEATLQAVLTYSDGKVSSLRGVVEGRYPRRDVYRGDIFFSVRATVESRP